MVLVGALVVFLIAWLRAGDDFDSRLGHFEARKGAGDNARWVSHATRLEFRAMVEADDAWKDVRVLERDPRPGEGLEPAGLP